MSKHTDIPLWVYSCLKAVYESRRYRAHGPEANIHRFTNPEIFRLMPDHERLDWSEAAQPTIIETTLSAMEAHTNV